MANPLAADNPISIVLAPIVWSVYFLFVYVLNSVACTKGFVGLTLFGFGIVPATVVIATLVTLAIMVWLAGLAWSRFAPVRDTDDHVHSADPELARLARRRFMALAGLLQAGLHILATLYVGLPALLVPEC